MRRIDGADFDGNKVGDLVSNKVGDCVGNKVGDSNGNKVGDFVATVGNLLENVLIHLIVLGSKLEFCDGTLGVGHDVGVVGDIGADVGIGVEVFVFGFGTHVGVGVGDEVFDVDIGA